MTRQEFLMVLSDTKYIDRTALATHDAEQRQRIEDMQDRIDRQANTITEYQAAEGALREALQALYDVQNGCPLPKYQADWDEAMVMTERLLKEHP